MVEVKPIHTKADYDAALERINQLMDAGFGTPEGEELDVLTTLVTAYENAKYPMDMPSAVDAIRFVMDQRGLEQKDFAALIGRSCASEVLSGKRALSMNQAKTLYKEWRIPAEALLEG